MPYCTCWKASPFVSFCTSVYRAADSDILLLSKAIFKIISSTHYVPTTRRFVVIARRYYSRNRAALKPFYKTRKLLKKVSFAACEYRELKNTSIYSIKLYQSVDFQPTNQMHPGAPTQRALKTSEDISIFIFMYLVYFATL